MVCPIGDTGGDFDTAAYRQEVRFLSCELGGMGRFSPASHQIGWQGCLRVLKGLGVIGPDVFAPLPADPTRFIDIGEASVHVTADKHGLAEIDRILGDRVAPGDTIGRVHDLHGFGNLPVSQVTPRAGIVAVRRRSALVAPGDHLCLIAAEIERKEVLRRLDSKSEDAAHR